MRHFLMSIRKAAKQTCGFNFAENKFKTLFQKVSYNRQFLCPALPSVDKANYHNHKEDYYKYGSGNYRDNQPEEYETQNHADHGQKVNLERLTDMEADIF